MTSHSSPVAAALDYVGRGWRVFPVHGIFNGRCTCGHDECSSPGKHPLTRRGLYDATTDEATVREWFRRWRRANVAIATGQDSRLLVVDIDMPKAIPSIDKLAAADRALGNTLTAATGGGGMHLYFAHPGRYLPNTSGRIPGFDGELPGIDIRSDGGYVVAPPSAHHSGGHYSWMNLATPIASLPAWVKEPDRTPLSGASATPAEFSGGGSAYGLHVLDAELDQLRRTGPGARNHQLNRAAFAIGQVVAGGELDEGAARTSLLSTALQIGLPEPEARQTIDSGFRGGAREPRSAPHRLI